MSAWAEADLDMFFDEDMPGYALATVGADSVPGLFRADYAEVLNGLVGHNGPSFRCASADVSTVDRGETISINAVTYRVVEKQLSDRGHALLMLESTA